MRLKLRITIFIIMTLFLAGVFKIHMCVYYDADVVAFLLRIFVFMSDSHKVSKVSRH